VDDESGLSVTLCDFGLCSKFDQKVELSEFVGSPGFFDPQMIIKGYYNADKSDLFSAGAVILEMVIGHHSFCDFWMVAYDYEVLKDKQKFAEGIHQTITNVPKIAGHLSEDLVDFLTKILHIDSSQRITVAEALSHKWLMSEASSAIETTNPLSHCVSSMNLEDLAISDYEGKLNSYESSLRRGNLLENSVSQRERAHLEVYTAIRPPSFSLPPNEPSTPKASGHKLPITDAFFASGINGGGVHLSK